MTKYNIRPATSEDIEKFYYNRTKPAQTMRALVMEHAGEIVGIAGYLIEDSRLVAFSEMKDGLPKKAIWRGVLAFREFIKDKSLPLIAGASKKYCNSSAFLKRVGFEYVDTFPEGDMFIWTQFRQ